MSLLKFLVPFGVSFMQSFLKEYNSPSPAGSTAHAAADAVVASGSHDRHFHWVAVRKAHASAFKAAYPNARTAEAFCQIVSSWEQSDPEGYQYLMPFAAQLVHAIKAHGHQCSFFVIIER